MLKIYSKVNLEKLLHIVNRLDEISGRTEIIEPENFLQLATLKYEDWPDLREMDIFK